MQRVEQGSTLVDQAAINRVNDIIGEISLASSMQDESIDRISHSVAQMEETTQHNAALVGSG